MAGPSDERRGAGARYSGVHIETVDSGAGSDTLLPWARADDKYNSGPFHFRAESGRPPPDDLTPRLRVDDGVLADIIRSLYCPESPYEFSVLGADILGQVYEQFLGKVIRLTAGHRAKVEEKPRHTRVSHTDPTLAYDKDERQRSPCGQASLGTWAA